MKRIEINENDLLANLNIVKEYKSKNTTLIAIVKSNGMGLGLKEYTKFLVKNEIDYFGVSKLEEALEIRRLYDNVNILMLTPTSLKEEMEQLIDNNIILSIDSIEQMDIIKKLNKHCKIHIKIDSGFGRHGFLYSDVNNILKCFTYQNVKIEGIFTHFSNPMNEKYTNMQFKRFKDVIELIQKNNIELPKQHVCSSIPFIKYQNMHLDMVRIGSLIQGRTSISIEGIKKIGILKCNVFKIKEFPRGYNVGYLNLYKTKKRTRTAFINIGTLDGFAMKKERDYFGIKTNIASALKELFKSNKDITVTINNKTYNYIGRLDINILIVDISNNNEINVGDEVLINISPINVSENINRYYYK